MVPSGLIRFLLSLYSLPLAKGSFSFFKGTYGGCCCCWEGTGKCVCFWSASVAGPLLLWFGMIVPGLVAGGLWRGRCSQRLGFSWAALRSWKWPIRTLLGLPGLARRRIGGSQTCFLSKPSPWTLGCRSHPISEFLPLPPPRTPICGRWLTSAGCIERSATGEAKC